MKRLGGVFFALCWLTIQVSCNNPSGKSVDSLTALKDGFTNPPENAWPKVYWWWLNGYTDSVRIKEELRAMKEAGISGVDIFEIGIRPASDPNMIIPAGPAFMSDSSVAAICFAVQEAGRLDMEVGLGLASSWNAGGSWMEPKHAAKTLYHSKILVRRQQPGKLTVTVPFPSISEDNRGKKRAIEYGADGRPVYWEDVAILAVPAGSTQLQDTSEVMDVTAYFDGANDMLSWDAPSGDWEIYRFVSSNSGEQLISPSPNSAGPIIDHFDSLAMEMHINYFVDRLKPVLGDFSGTALKYFT